MVWDSEEELREAINENQAIVDANNAKVQELSIEKGKLQCAENKILNTFENYVDEICDEDVLHDYFDDKRWRGNTLNEFINSIDDILLDSVYKLRDDIESSLLQIEDAIDKIDDEVSDLNWDTTIKESKIDRYETELYWK
ncbi:MAG: hypothetical protein IIT48_03960 [Lachnospiraceae bacterium]|nr:hypothetical protein [Lachnospiraceae bacterium]